MIINKLQCKLGLHDTKNFTLIENKAVGYNTDLVMRCKHCGKYGWLTCELNEIIWSSDIQVFPEDIQGFIIKNNI